MFRHSNPTRTPICVPLVVPLHTTGPLGLKVSMISDFPPTRAIGIPPPMAFANVDRSGYTP